MSDEFIFEVKRMSKLLALNLIKDLKTEDKFHLLSLAEFQPKEIAILCNTTSNTVRVALSRKKTQKTKKKKEVENG